MCIDVSQTLSNRIWGKKPLAVNGEMAASPLGD